MKRLPLSFTIAVVFCLPAASVLAEQEKQPAVKLYLRGRPEIVVEEKVQERFTPDILLVSIKEEAKPEEVDEALKMLDASIDGKIKFKKSTLYVVRTPSGKFQQTEAALAKDTVHFQHVQRNHLLYPEAMNANDPLFARQRWYLRALNVEPAWSSASGKGVVIAIVDTGVSPGADLLGKTFAGFDAQKGQSGQTDLDGHGTAVAATAAAKTDNKNQIASPAKDATIFPLRVTDELSAIRAIQKATDLSIKVCNLSMGFGPDVKNSKFNADSHYALHEACRDFYDAGGLLFTSMGNSDSFDANRPLPYMIGVSALEQRKAGGLQLAPYSNYGKPVWFACPGSGILAPDHKGRLVFHDGTSFASPLCASVAAMIWSANPKLTNKQVLDAMIKSAVKPKASAPTSEFGYGLPNATAAVDLTARRSKDFDDPDPFVSEAGPATNFGAPPAGAPQSGVSDWQWCTRPNVPAEPETSNDSHNVDMAKQEEWKYRPARVAYDEEPAHCKKDYWSQCGTEPPKYVDYYRKHVQTSRPDDYWKVLRTGAERGSSRGGRVIMRKDGYRPAAPGEPASTWDRPWER